MLQSPAKLYSKGSFLIIRDDSNQGSVLLCQTCTVVTNASLKILVHWLKQTDNEGIFQYLFKSEVDTERILGIAHVVKDGSNIVIDATEIVRLKKLVWEDNVIKDIENKSSPLENVVNTVEKVPEKQSFEMQCNRKRN